MTRKLNIIDKYQIETKNFEEYDNYRQTFAKRVLNIITNNSNNNNAKIQNILSVNKDLVVTILISKELTKTYTSIDLNQYRINELQQNNFEILHIETYTDLECNKLSLYLDIIYRNFEV